MLLRNHPGACTDRSTIVDSKRVPAIRGSATVTRSSKSQWLASPGFTKRTPFREDSPARLVTGISLEIPFVLGSRQPHCFVAFHVAVVPVPRHNVLPERMNGTLQLPEAEVVESKVPEKFSVKAPPPPAIPIPVENELPATTIGGVGVTVKVPLTLHGPMDAERLIPYVVISFLRIVKLIGLLCDVVPAQLPSLGPGELPS
jgi:hypothetical protein